MNEPSQLTEFGKVFIYLLMGFLFVGITFFLGRLVAIKRPNPVKLSSYECGEEPVGSSWVQFNSKFYVVALIFLLFDVEMVFIFPWTTVFGQSSLIAADDRWGWLSLAEMFIFVGILLLGLFYIWRKGDLNWIKAETLPLKVPGKIPASAYDLINAERYQVRPVTASENGLQEAVVPEQSASTAPAFRPRFKKPTS